ncbi:hypothetical protein HOY82DRAFT_625775 [Tuber indicum]|nr:hypothetical protein HOY82DRAFT_625775 [Tuber indicum]
MLRGSHDTGPGTPGGIRAGGGRGCGALRPMHTTHHDYAMGRTPPLQLLGKRCAFKADPTPPWSFIPKVLTISIHSPPGKLTSASISILKYLPPELYPTTNSAKEPFLRNTLIAEVILTLQEENEGRLDWAGVSPEDADRWESLHPEVIENDEIRQEYNFLNGSFENFKVTGDFCGKSKKIPDAYIMLPDADSPTVICETGWSEKRAALMDDARLWILHADGQTRLVIIVVFTEGDTKSSPKVELVAKGPAVENERQTGGGIEKPVVGGDVPEVPGEEPEVESEGLEVKNALLKMVVDSIDETTNYHDLVARLQELNHQGKLRKLLVGNLGATVYNYKANKVFNNIVYGSDLDTVDSN